MFCGGDGWNQFEETLDYANLVAVEYMEELIAKTINVYKINSGLVKQENDSKPLSGSKRKKKPEANLADCLKFVLRHEPEMTSRIDELLETKQKIAEYRKGKIRDGETHKK